MLGVICSGREVRAKHSGRTVLRGGLFLCVLTALACGDSDPDPDPELDAGTDAGADSSMVDAFVPEETDGGPPDSGPPPDVELSLEVTGTGFGSVASSPSGVLCEDSCVTGFAPDTAVTLTATAATGSTFMGWSGACTGTSDCIVTLSEAQAVTATFTLDAIALTAVVTTTSEGCPFFVVLADVGGSSALDMVAANQLERTIDTRIGVGDGTFGARVSDTTTDKPFSLALMYLDGDAFLDAVTSNYEDDSISILLGAGGGDFGTPTIVAAGDGPYFVASGDFNEDDHADVVVVNFSDNNAQVYLNDESGGLETPVPYTTGTWPTSVSVADLNGDDHEDLIITNRSSNSVSVLLGNGNGTFQAKVDFPTGEAPYVSAIVDFNRDGDLDVATANYATNNVSVLLGSGSGMLGTAAHTSSGMGMTGPSSVAAGDMNGDLWPDLVVTNLETDTVTVLLQGRGGAFPVSQEVAAGIDPNSVALGDLNGDSRIDIAIANKDTGVSVILQTAP